MTSKLLEFAGSKHNLGTNQYMKLGQFNYLLIKHYLHYLKSMCACFFTYFKRIYPYLTKTSSYYQTCVMIVMREWENRYEIYTPPNTAVIINYSRHVTWTT